MVNSWHTKIGAGLCHVERFCVTLHADGGERLDSSWNGCAQIYKHITSYT